MSRVCVFVTTGGNPFPDALRSITRRPLKVFNGGSFVSQPLLNRGYE